MAVKAIAQPISDDELTRRQAQQHERAPSRAIAVPDVFTPAGIDGQGALMLPNEQPCFTVSAIEWRGTELFDWLADEGKSVHHKCIGAERMVYL